ncbi:MULTISPECIES: serine aminopeptidase domain-containing protein [Aerococcus]|uniref:serine aminopeptidase domain-containing protein n=1 Tax=Aerococcus urinae (strain CCUG 59500 / ACS-120-V-Col10a) TaxID=2976812 RepID=UPI000200E7E0|nr:alpha/beta hydrolase [Aerococcus sp. Group 1]AEA00945.1 hypothetical protein HMPREF9243_1894 [Aerococcus sp. Group 1]MCY3030371.1 alpha/beta hydrolase [Aerococcus sp. Group 1]MCY3054877.1 alpha/beta hydrolase [Aerococcus sp. Group 1]MCY3056607.1 alpha/beta hydrolase [Aerococcus sp. Group 1]MCY3061811.1 alpha/beta hydrolase [Aerococcus sp. Group 1]
MDGSFTVKFTQLEGIALVEIYPQEEESKNMVIGYHGYKLNKEALIKQGLIYAANGFHVFLPDAPLHGDRQVDPFPETSIGIMPGIIVQSFEEFPRLVSAIQKQYTIDNLFVYGASMGGIMAAMIGTAYYQSLSGLAIHIAGLNLEEQLRIIYGDRYPDEIDASKLAVILSNNPTDHPEEFLNQPVYVYNGGADNADILSLNQEDIQKFKADFPKAHLEWTVLDEVGHRVPIRISQQTAEFFQATLS